MAAVVVGLGSAVRIQFSVEVRGNCESPANLKPKSFAQVRDGLLSQYFVLADSTDCGDCNVSKYFDLLDIA